MAEGWNRRSGIPFIHQCRRSALYTYLSGQDHLRGTAGFKTENEGYITIEELKKQRFVTQREGCDADVNHVMNKYDLPGGGGSYIADDMSAVSLVMGGFGVCLMPELVIRNIPFPVDVLAPAVQKMQSYILESFQKKAEEEQ